MKQVISIKFLLLSFMMGTLILSLVALFLIPPTKQPWVLLILYSWSGAAFIIYKTSRLTKRIENGAFKE